MTTQQQQKQEQPFMWWDCTTAFFGRPMYLLNFPEIHRGILEGFEAERMNKLRPAELKEEFVDEFNKTHGKDPYEIPEHLKDTTEVKVNETELKRIK